MSEQQRRELEFSGYDAMSTEELQDILRQEALSEGEISDTEKILYITEVLATREKEQGSAMDISRAYGSFVEHYMPETPEKPVKTLRFPRWLQTAAMVAVVMAVLFCGIASASAGGYDLFGMVANWTAEVFHFSSITDGTEFVEPEQGKSTEFQSLQAALDKYKIKQKLAPTWVPDGYELSFISVSDTPFEVSFFAMYLRQQELIEISVRQLLNGDAGQIEKNDQYIEIYEVNGIAYHLIDNHDRMQALWVVEGFECVIAGNMTIEELKQMIDSI